MAFSFSKILKPKKEKPVAPTQPVPKIDYKGGTKYATNETNDIYLDFEELGGFPFLKTVIIGNINVKIKRVGCTLIFIFKNDTLTLNSDDTTVESNQIKKSGVYYTEIDFEVNEDDVKKIKNNKVVEIKYTFKNNTYTFKTI